RCALELAILDAYARHFQEPLSAVTRSIAPELCHSQPAVRYSGAITSSTGFKLRLVAWAYRLYGFRQVKVKVGIAGQDDLRRLRAVRRALGAGVQLRVDANEAWPAHEVVDRILELEPFGIECVEQPVSQADVAILSEIRGRIRT